MKKIIYLCIFSSLFACGLKDKKSSAPAPKKVDFVERKKDAAASVNKLYDTISGELATKGFNADSYRQKTLSLIDKISPVGVKADEILSESEVKAELDATVEHYKSYVVEVKTENQMSLFSIMHYEEINSILYEKAAMKDRRTGLKNVWKSFISCNKTEKECKNDAVNEIFKYTSESSK